jgi:pimeloyl-ACP methyl ester carboxylesterase
VQEGQQVGVDGVGLRRGHGNPFCRERLDAVDDAKGRWLTNTGVSSARLYWESKLAFFAPKGIAIPVAVSAFPDELYQAPRSWTERAYPKLVYYNRPNKGGHFAAWEQPELFVADLRAGFKSLR